MKQTRITILLFSVLCMSFQACSMKTNSNALPSADQIIDGYVQALGGKSAVEKLNSRVIRGHIEWRDAIGVAEHFTKAPNKYMSITALGTGGRSMREGFNGQSGWGLDVQTPLRDWTDAEIELAKRTRDFYKDIKLREIYPKITVKGRENDGGRDLYVLECTPASGKPEMMYFDSQTGLLARHEYEVDTPKGPRQFQYYYEDYKEVDGVKIAFTVRRTKPVPYTFKVNEVKHNEPIEDEKFEKPHGS